MKNRCYLLFTMFFVLLSAFVSAQTKVSGKVQDSAGEPLIGASVVELGTTNGVLTDNEGNYSVTVKSGSSSLQFSMVGLEMQTVAVGNQTVINITLRDGKELNEVVVTALGVERSAKSLTYSTQRVDGEELSRVRDVNVINSLAGKATGVTINRSASGAGGSTKVVLRGNKSIAGNNNVLYVIDGIPMNNNISGQPSDVWGNSEGRGNVGTDGGDGIGNLNPDDIESINILKGASAAALYGSQAANGVIIITTKKGKAGTTRVDFSSNLTFDNAIYLPQMQTKYGQTSTGAVTSWGAATSATDHVKDFFQTGTNWTNSLSLSGGNNIAQTYFSYSNTSANGILPTNTFGRHNVNFRETAKFFGDKLSLDANVNYVNQKVVNRPATGLYFNPLVGTYLFPRGLNFNDFKNNYEVFRPSRNMMGQNWIFADPNGVGDGEDIQQNPYWILNRNQRVENRNRFITSATARFDINSKMFVQARGSIDRTYDEFSMKAFATTQSTLADYNGRYLVNTSNNTLSYGDLIFNIKQDFGNIGMVAVLGTSINDFRTKTQNFDSKGGDLRFANVFSLQNMLAGSSFAEGASHRQIQSVFANLQFSFGKGWYVDVTGRNDWSSTLAFTPSKSFFYPSVGVNAVLSEMTKLPEWVDFAKVRASYARVGNDIPFGVSNPLNSVSSAGGLSFNNRQPFAELQPELTKSLEIGTEWRLLKNRLNIDFTWYKTNTSNQFFILNAPLGSSFSQYYVNAGDVQNSGIELGVSYNALKTKDLSWTTTFNLTANRNKIVSLHPDLKGQYALTDPGVNNYGLYIREGGMYGDIFGKLAKRNGDAIVVDNAGAPVANKSGLEYVGNPTPRALLGWNNAFTYQKFYLNFLIDCRFGGEVMSMTEAMLDERGVSQRTADARDANGVDVKVVKEDGTAFSGKPSAAAYYQRIGGRAGYTGEYMYDATNVRLREFALGYNLGKLGGAKNASLSVVGRNLFFFYRKAPFDPELAMSTGNGLQGVDMFSVPQTRSIGLNLKVSF